MKTKPKNKTQSKLEPVCGTNDKTILVVYGDTNIDPATHITLKRYPFNTTANLSIGDIIESPSYTTPMHVVDVMARYKYINILTGELSNTKAASTNQRKVRPLIIHEAITSSTIVASIIKRNENKT